MNLKELKKYVKESEDFGSHNTMAILDALSSIEKKIKTKQPKIEIKDGRYKELLKRIIRQNKLIIDLLKLDHFDATEEEREIIRNKVA